MNEILKFKIFNNLKKTYRASSVDSRKESDAEHSWSCLMLADFFLNKMKVNKDPVFEKIDILKVYELLMYHDVVEIDAGDTPLSPDVSVSEKKERELIAIQSLSNKLPIEQSKKLISLFNEFEDMKTLESRFANAIDKFDPIIQEMDYKQDWKGWKKDFLIDSKKKYFQEFPIIYNSFLEIIDYFEENNYFS